MPLSTDDVRKIADLARLELTADETQSFGQQLAAILEYMEKLNELDLSNVEPMSHCGTGDSDPGYALRDDVVRPSLGQSSAVQNAPDADAGFFRVPRVIGG